MSLFSNKAAVCLLFDQVVNNGAFEIVGDIVDADFVGQFPERPSSVNGVAEYTQYVSDLRTSFPDLHVKIEGGWLLAEEDAHAVGKGTVVHRVVANLQVGGTHRGEYLGVAPTERYASWSQVHLLRCEDGRIVGDQVVSDQGSLLGQLT